MQRCISKGLHRVEGQCGVQARREVPHSFGSMGLNADRLLQPGA